VNNTTGWSEVTDTVVAEYVWIDGSGIILRSKCRSLDGPINSVADLPEWNYDGSSCYQATTDNSEIIMKPVAMYRDPFRKGNHLLVMTETYKWTDGTCTALEPANTNFRVPAKKIFDADTQNEEPWYGIEQEYTLVGTKTKFTTWPLGWPSNGYPGPQGPYYCSVGASNCFGRVIADAHYRACLYAGIKVSGTNAEVMPGQWEYQVGPVTGINVGDQLWMSRYILQRVAEDFNVTISFAPKLFEDWNGSGCHCNFSTKTMREGSQGMPYINTMMEKFAAKHADHIELYGDDNAKRLTGIHETSSMSTFSYGVGNRAASFRIPTSTAAANGKGYIEDRRPASNIDPYLVAGIMFDTGVLEVSQSADIKTAYRKWLEWKKSENLGNI
jgi:glutamine synthetase